MILRKEDLVKRKNKKTKKRRKKKFNFFCDIFLKINSLIFGECTNLTINLMAIEASIIKFREIWSWSIEDNNIPVAIVI